MTLLGFKFWQLHGYHPDVRQLRKEKNFWEGLTAIRQLALPPNQWYVVDAEVGRWGTTWFNCCFGSYAENDFYLRVWLESPEILYRTNHPTTTALDKATMPSMTSVATCNRRTRLKSRLSKPWLPNWEVVIFGTADTIYFQPCRDKTKSEKDDFFQRRKWDFTEKKLIFLNQFLNLNSLDV